MFRKKTNRNGSMWRTAPIFEQFNWKNQQEHNSIFLTYISTQWKFLLFNLQNTWNEYTNKWRWTEQQTQNCSQYSSLVAVYSKTVSCLYLTDNILTFLKLRLQENSPLLHVMDAKNRDAEGCTKPAAAPEPQRLKPGSKVKGIWKKSLI